MKPSLENPKDRICVALDVDDIKKAERLTIELVDHVGFFKIGLELFTEAGPAAIRAVKKIGGKVFLDLKFHDIPTTAVRAAKVASRLGVSLLNFHASGGLEMMATSAASFANGVKKEGAIQPYLLAVTILTSLDSEKLEKELHIVGSLKDQVVHLAKLSVEAGFDGVIASPKEITLLREALGDEILIVTPGIRPHGADAHDQRRIKTPQEAIKEGADILVIGRPITASPNPADAAKRILDEIN